MRKDVFDRFNRAVRLLLWVVVIGTCVLAFIQSADRNYRSSEGRLGNTMPPYQIEITSGTAPAPYVYRQAVPQLRRVMMRALPPGHVAVLLDAVFASIAVGASIVLARTLLKADLVILGALIATLASITVYPNDKPEAVASVAIVCLLCALVLTHRHTAAIIIAILAALVRPEIPILFGFAMVMTQLLVAHSRLIVHADYLPYGLTAIAGLAYLLVARFLLWPGARYPAGVSPFMLLRNLTLPFAWPALVYGMCLLCLCLVLVLVGYSLLRQDKTYPWSKHVRPMIGVQFFCLLYVAFLLLFAQVEEIRVFQPIIVPVILGGVWIQTLAYITTDPTGMSN